MRTIRPVIMSSLVSVAIKICPGMANRDARNGSATLRTAAGKKAVIMARASCANIRAVDSPHHLDFGSRRMCDRHKATWLR